MKGQKFAIVDIETTGGKAGRDKIIEIAIAVVENNEIISSYETLIDPECYIPSNISYLTGISQEMVQDKPKFFEIAKDIVDVTQDCVFVAHNVRFDYTFIREQFKSLGYTYSRKTLCTVRLSRLAFPKLRKHSLGYLIEHFNIQVKDRHRAMADVLATTFIFNKITQSPLFIAELEQSISLGIKESLLPQNITRSSIAELPEDPGIYYMLDHSGTAVYIGKSVNIRSRVSSHFAKKSKKAALMQDLVHAITFELTGSDLMANFLESIEIKKHLPSINRAQKQIRYPYHIFTSSNEAGYHTLCISTKKSMPEGYIFLASFASKQSAYGRLSRLIEQHQLCSKLVGLTNETHACFNHQIGKCTGACIGLESVEDYNERLNQSLEHLSQELEGSYLIIEKGRSNDEKGAILILNGRIQGYGFLERDTLNYSNVEDIQRDLEWVEENAELRYIIKRYLAKNKRKQIIPIPSPVID